MAITKDLYLFPIYPLFGDWLEHHKEQRKNVFRRPIDIFYSEALKYFRESGGSEDTYKWLVGARLVLFNFYREEIDFRFKLLHELCERVQGRVLDVGSGSGFPAFSFSLLDHVKEVVGFEKSLEYSEFLTKLEKKIKKLRFIHADFLATDMHLEKFDSVVFFYILHDLEPEPYLSKALELLEYDGQILIADFDIKALYERIEGFCRDKNLKIIESKIMGIANTHRVRTNAFILVFKKK